MSRSIGFILFILFPWVIKSQITLIGHNKINNTPLTHVEITVTESDNIIKTISTEESESFKIKLDYNKNYKLYFKHPDFISMILSIDSRNIPEDKQNIHMIHEIEIPFFYLNDQDIKEEAFNQPIQKIFFDGVSKMVSDTAYSREFYNNIVVRKNDTENNDQNPNIEKPNTITAHVILNNKPKLKVTLKTIYLLAANGRIIKELKTDRFGQFIGVNIKLSELDRIEMKVFDGTISNGSEVNLFDADRKLNNSSKYMNSSVVWKLSPEDKIKLINNGFTSNVGGKLIMDSNGKKTFFAGKTVFLANKRNTIIGKTTTNMFGGFVFDNIKPEQQYYIGVDAKEIGPGEKIDLLNKDDQYGVTLEVTGAGRISTPLVSDNNSAYNLMVISDDEMKMNVDAKLYGDDLSKPIGKTKILLLNDAYEVIDSTETDDLGTFKFKYLPYLKRFFLSAENANSSLDLFKNILVYSNDDNLVKIMTHIKGNKFIYKPIASETSQIRTIEMDDPWLEFSMGGSKKGKETIIMEPILFETGKYTIPNSATSTLDKVVNVLKSKPDIKIEIRAHTDSKGNDASNLKLSELRAKSVLNYLIKAGISPSRLTAKGYGESKLLNHCNNNTECSDIEHAVNRRVEFVIK